MNLYGIVLSQFYCHIIQILISNFIGSMNCKEISVVSLFI